MTKTISLRNKIRVPILWYVLRLCSFLPFVANAFLGLSTTCLAGISLIYSIVETFYIIICY
jgi:hypothetical protein